MPAFGAADVDKVLAFGRNRLGVMAAADFEVTVEFALVQQRVSVKAKLELFASCGIDDAADVFLAGKVQGFKRAQVALVERSPVKKGMMSFTEAVAWRFSKPLPS